MVKTAFVFPGQGSQSIGMLSDFLPEYPIITELFSTASQIAGYDLWDLAQNGPLERLNQAEFTEVLMLVADLAVYSLLMQQGIPEPELIAGHSLGEYAALVVSQSLSFHDAFQLVTHRARLMQDAVPLGKGAMAAILGLTDEQVQLLCAEASVPDESVTPANYNSLGQVVVAGHTPAINRLIDLALNSDARMAKIIPVSVPYHCSLMKDAADKFAKKLAEVEFKVPVIPVINNVDLEVYNSPQQIRDRLKEQLYSPLRWVETIQLFKTQGIECIVECGPGKVLSGLVKRIDRTFNTLSVYDTIGLDHIVEQLNNPVRG